MEIFKKNGLDIIEIKEHENFFNYLKNIINKYNNNLSISILEVGCGNGTLSKMLLLDNPQLELMAIDSSEKAIENAKKILGEHVIQEDFLQFQKNDTKKYDIILFTKSLHHIFPLKEALKHCFNLLKDDGFLILDEFSRETMNNETARWIFNTLELLECTGAFRKVDHHMHHHHHHQQIHNSENNREEINYLDKYIQYHYHNPPLSTGKEMLSEIKELFDIIEFQEQVPFLYHYLARGLERSEKGEKLLDIFMKQEKERLKDKVILSPGILLIAKKKKN